LEEEVLDAGAHRRRQDLNRFIADFEALSNIIEYN
jgi:hypothetical protein